MAERGLEQIHESNFALAEVQSERLRPLLDHVAASIDKKISDLRADGKNVEVFGPEWCYANPEIAGQMHADVIVGAYGSTYALPNKDPEANTAALKAKNLDMYLMLIDGKVTGTTCMVDVGNGVAELGRSASQGRTSNTIIQDLRIFDWLTNNATAKKYHTLFTTLRTAPNRDVPIADDESFIMRGGQAVTEHWKKFPGLTVNGFAPLYLKQGKLEQFSYATITRGEYDTDTPVYLGTNVGQILVEYWHRQYNIDKPVIKTHSESASLMDHKYSVGYPPSESGLTELVHADIHLDVHGESSKTLADCVKEAEAVGSPFTQVMLPVSKNTLHAQQELELNNFRIYGYIPGTSEGPATLLYGRVRSGVDVVPTAWTLAKEENPLWDNLVLRGFAKETEKKWHSDDNLADL